jgi:cell wall-associated NlpC family hydrolase
VSSVTLLSTLQQVQANLAARFPSNGTASTSTETATLDSFHQVLALLTPGTAGGIMGLSTLPASTAGGAASAGTTAADSTATTTGSVTGAQVVADSKKYLGVKYVLGGTSMSGIDCSALVQKTYGDLGITLPRLVHQQKLMGTAVPSLAQAQPGDLIVFKGGDHIAIYEGNGRVMHAPYPGRVVSDQKLWVGDSGIETIRRIVPSAGSADAASAGTAAASSTAAARPTTSAAVQAAALAAVRAIIQSDSGLLSSSTNSNSSSSTGGSVSSSLQAAISAMSAGASGDSTSSSVTSPATSAASIAARQALAASQASLLAGLG